MERAPPEFSAHFLPISVRSPLAVPPNGPSDFESPPALETARAKRRMRTNGQARTRFLPARLAS